MPTVGAPGSVFGIFMAFAMLFPNTELFLFFVSIPIKAKCVIAIYGMYELYAGVKDNPADNVAHFAHLGGVYFPISLFDGGRSRVGMINQLCSQPHQGILGSTLAHNLALFLHASHNPRYCIKQYQIQRNFYHCQNLYRGFWAAGLYYSRCKNKKTYTTLPLSAAHAPRYGSVL